MNGALPQTPKLKPAQEFKGWLKAICATCPKKKMQRQRAGYPMCPARATPHGARTSEASHQEGNKRPQPPTRSAAKGGATAREERAKRATERNEAPPAADTKCRERGGNSAPRIRAPHSDLHHTARGRALDFAKCPRCAFSFSFKTR